MTTIGDHSFYNCIALPFISIPDSVTDIHDQAFMGCTLLEARVANFVIAMSVNDYYKESHQQRIKRRVAVLASLKTINDARIERTNGGGDNRRRRLNPDNVRDNREFDGVLMEERITAFDMWREMVMWM